MASRVAVTKVTIEYVCEGRTFTMVFDDPSSIDSIVLSQRDRHRLQTAQGAPIVNHAFDPLRAGRLRSLRDKELDPLPIRVAETTDANASALASPTAGRSLWWHTSDCPWFHPEGDE